MTEHGLEYLISACGYQDVWSFDRLSLGFAALGMDLLKHGFPSLTRKALNTNLHILPQVPKQKCCTALTRYHWFRHTRQAKHAKQKNKLLFFQRGSHV